MLLNPFNTEDDLSRFGPWKWQNDNIVKIKAFSLVFGQNEYLHRALRSILCQKRPGRPSRQGSHRNVKIYTAQYPHKYFALLRKIKEMSDFHFFSFSSVAFIPYLLTNFLLETFSASAAQRALFKRKTQLKMGNRFPNNIFPVFELFMEEMFSAQHTLSDNISADKTAENLTCCQKFCPPKIFSAENFVRRNILSAEI